MRARRRTQQIIVGLRGVIAFVMAIGPVGHPEIQQCDADGDEVEGGPLPAPGDEGGGHEWADGAADAVAAVEETEGDGMVGEVGAEGVVEGEVDGLAEPGEEEGEDDDGEGGRADEHDVAGHHDGFGEEKRFRSAQAGE